MNAIDDAFVSGILFLSFHSTGFLQNSASAWNSSPPPSIGCLHISASAEQKSAVHVGLVVSAQGCIFFLYPSSLLVQRCLFRVSKTPLSTRFACSWVPLYSRQSYIRGWIHLGPSDVFTPRRIHFGSCAARFAREPSACRRWASRWCRHLFLLPVCWSLPLQLYINLHYMINYIFAFWRTFVYFCKPLNVKYIS